MRKKPTAVSLDVASLELLQSELRAQLAPQVTAKEIAEEITKLLGTGNSITREQLAIGLAKKFRSLKSYRLDRLIANRPMELAAILNSSTRDDHRQSTDWILKEPTAKRRAKITSEKERIHRNKAAKNRHEHLRRSYVTTPGWIERQFAQRPRSVLLAPFDALPPTGDCLDDVFHGGAVQMCDGTYSLQSLFGLRRKKLIAAGKGSRRGREVFYGWRAVLRCMVALLKHTGPTAPWLPEPTRRRTVLISVILRARQKATRAIGETFAKKLYPYLN